MRSLPFLLFLPFAIYAHGDSTMGSTTNPLKIEKLDPNSYVVVLTSSQTILDTAVDEVVTSLNLKPKRKYKSGKVKGFSGVLSTSQLKSLKSNPKVRKSASSV